MQEFFATASVLVGAFIIVLGMFKGMVDLEPFRGLGIICVGFFFVLMGESLFGTTTGEDE